MEDVDLRFDVHSFHFDPNDESFFNQLDLPLLLLVVVHRLIRLGKERARPTTHARI